MSETYTFHVNGMHCASCIALTESELSDLPNVSNVKASLKKCTIKVTGEFGETTPEQLATDLTIPLQPHGYTLTIEKNIRSIAWTDFNLALPIATGFIGLFIVLQKTGLVHLTSTTHVGFGTAFVVGLVASVSTCMAVVGGLTLSLSANFAKGGEKIRPQLLFHAGRLASFFILGGLLGKLGTAIHLGGTGTLILNFILVLVMLGLGIHLLDIFPWTKKLLPTLPAGIGKHIHGLKKINHALLPPLLGAATFFLPCGFTQSMQVYTLTTGSFGTGALIMLSFALGTLPALALISFSSFSFHTKKQAGIFFKAAGLIIIAFALFNLLNSLVAADIIPSLFTF